MQILVRKYTAKPRFKPHYNTAMGKYYGTVKEYTQDLKEKGLELVKELPAQHSPPRKPYVPSPWARQMVETIKASKKRDGSVKLPDRFLDSLKKKKGKRRACHKSETSNP